MTMPPEPMRVVGHAEIGGFFASVPMEGRLDLIRLLPARANGQPALAAFVQESAPCSSGGGPACSRRYQASSSPGIPIRHRGRLTTETGTIFCGSKSTHPGEKPPARSQNRPNSGPFQRRAADRDLKWTIAARS
jgi:hypothetical protein